MANMSEIHARLSREADHTADILRDQFRFLQTPNGPTTDEKFTAIAMVCGPPSDTFRKDATRAMEFTRLVKELFNVAPDTTSQRGIYRLYERWHNSNELQRMLNGKQSPAEAPEGGQHGTQEAERP